MKVLVEYKPEIHEKLIKYMDEQVAKGNAKMQQGVNIPTKELNVLGKTIVLGQKLKETINQNLVFSFYYEIVGDGKMEITFKSMGDKLPLIPKMCRRKIHNSLKREFKDKIISVKEVK
jgi:hypothetical protein